MADEKVRYVTVMAHPQVGDRVAVWDRSVLHPHESGTVLDETDEQGRPYVDVLIVGSDRRPVRVAETAVINDALGGRPGEEKLVRLSGDELKAAEAAHAKAVEAREARRAAMLAAANPVAPVRATPADARAAEKRAADAEARAEKAEAELAAMRAKAEADAKAKAGGQQP